jgi:hypothetical protein
MGNYEWREWREWAAGGILTTEGTELAKPMAWGTERVTEETRSEEMAGVYSDLSGVFPLRIARVGGRKKLALM